MLKVEGIAFRFLPDPVQIKNALEVSFFFYYYVKECWLTLL